MPVVNHFQFTDVDAKASLWKLKLAHYLHANLVLPSVTSSPNVTPTCAEPH